MIRKYIREMDELRTGLKGELLRYGNFTSGNGKEKRKPKTKQRPYTGGIVPSVGSSVPRSKSECEASLPEEKHAQSR